MIFILSCISFLSIFVFFRGQICPIELRTSRRRESFSRAAANIMPRGSPEASLGSQGEDLI